MNWFLFPVYNYVLRFGLLVAIIFNSELLTAQETASKFQIVFSSGYQQENLSWSIAGNSNGQNPDVYSELKWKHTKRISTAVHLKWNILDRFSVFGGYNRAFTYSGRVNDTDYQGDNRSEPVYSGDFSNNKGFADELNAAVGYNLFNHYPWNIAIFTGYGKNRQHLFVTDPGGDYPGLNSNYKTNWKGPFVYLNASFSLTHSFTLSGGFTYHQVKYHADADWNLIAEFRHPKSYSHFASGYGIDAAAKLAFNINRNISVSLTYSYFTWETGKGTDQLYLKSGETYETQLNQVKRYGSGYSGAITFSF